MAGLDRRASELRRGNRPWRWWACRERKSVFRCSLALSTSRYRIKIWVLLKKFILAYKYVVFRRILHLKGCLDQGVEKLELVFQQKRAANLFLKAAEKNWICLKAPKQYGIWWVVSHIWSGLEWQVSSSTMYFTWCIETYGNFFMGSVHFFIVL